MATTPKTSRNNPASRNTPVKRNRTSTVTASKSKTSAITRMYRHPVGKTILIILAVIVVFGLNLLITLNHFERFFILLGVEWIVATLVGWIMFVFKDKLKA